jgi:hypothetical protein
MTRARWTGRRPGGGGLPLINTTLNGDSHVGVRRGTQCAAEGWRRDVTIEPLHGGPSREAPGDNSRAGIFVLHCQWTIAKHGAGSKDLSSRATGSEFARH